MEPQQGYGSLTPAVAKASLWWEVPEQDGLGPGAMAGGWLAGWWAMGEEVGTLG